VPSLRPLQPLLRKPHCIAATRPELRRRTAARFRRPTKNTLFFIALFIGFLATAAGQQPAQPAPSEASSQQNPPAQGNPPGQIAKPAQTSPDVEAEVPEAGAGGKLVIHDQAEYNAFVTAANTQDPTERAEALQSFAEKYPKSVVASDALEEALDAWQTLGDNIKVLEVAKELVAADQGNVRALAIVVALDRLSAAQGDQSALDELCLYSTAGMREISMWTKPGKISDDDFAKLNKQMNIIFSGAAGYCAMQERSYSQARDWFTRVFQVDPTNLQNIYQLAIADLELAPIDADGFWYCAKAIQMAKSSSSAGAASGMESYCKPKYATYHGSGDGWDAILSLSATQNVAPPDFAKGITAAPPQSPAPAATEPRPNSSQPSH
jgi:tetratricopeptide (TPR) repeat protein